MSSGAPRLPLRPSWRAEGRSADVVRRLPAAARSLVAGGRWAEAALVAVVAVCLLAVRARLLPWDSEDYTTYVAVWYRYLQVHGFAGLGDAFANYNMPYLYLLWFGTLLHAEPLAWVKLLSGASDLAMGLGGVVLLRRLGAGRPLALTGGAALLLLPEVLLNSAAWGQADSTYTTFLIWAVVAMLRGRDAATWILIGAAFAFKLQAAFVLPAFAVVHLTRRYRWWTPLLGIAAVVALDVPALLAGRSPGSLASIYLDQAGTYKQLTLNAPSLYALLPDSRFEVLKSSGIVFAVACVALLSVLVLAAARRRPLTDRDVVLFLAALATLAPWTLPMMHERYFYVANVLLFLLAMLDRRLLPWALVAQAVAVMAYAPFLFRAEAPLLPMGVLALIEGAVLVVVVRELLRRTGASAMLRTEEAAEPDRAAA